MMGNPNNTDSVNILNLIELNTIGAEIGVWEGSTSIQIVKHRSPKKMYLVDPYSVRGYIPADEANDPTFSYEKYYNNYAKLTGGKSEEHFEKYYDGVYNRVVDKFKSYQNVEICRMNSTDWFNSFDGEKLDWIYIDGDHSYTGVINDLENCLKVLKPNGVILGDDYKWGRDGDKGGVKKAVNEFVAKYNYNLEKHGQNQFRIQL